MKPVFYTQPADDDANTDDYVMPCAEALLAGTLALMTGHARCNCAAHRQMMAYKATENLVALAQYTHFPSGFKTIFFALHAQWIELIQAEYNCQFANTAAQGSLTFAEQSRALWHTTPETIQ